MIWPLIGTGNQARADGVVAGITPFFGVAFVASELGVPAVALPDGLQVGLLETDEPFPKGNPLGNVFGLAVCRGAEQMNVFRHDDIAANAPLFSGPQKLLVRSVE